MRHGATETFWSRVNPDVPKSLPSKSYDRIEEAIIRGIFGSIIAVAVKSLDSLT